MGWDEEAATWDDHPAVQAYAQAAYASLVDHLEAHGTALAGRRVLDFGCGSGLLTVAMAAEAVEVVGLDVSRPMIEVLQSKSVDNVRGLVGALAEHDLGTFDLITCSSVCAFVDDYPSTAKALVEHLMPGGWLLQWDWELDPQADEPYGLTGEAVSGTLRAAGLVDVAVRTGFEVPFEGMTMAPILGVGRAPA